MTKALVSSNDLDWTIASPRILLHETSAFSVQM